MPPDEQRLGSGAATLALLEFLALSNRALLHSVPRGDAARSRGWQVYEITHRPPDLGLTKLARLAPTPKHARGQRHQRTGLDSSAKARP